MLTQTQPAPAIATLSGFRETEIRQIIGVEEPYFALTGMREVEQGVLQAAIPIESPLGGETPPISTQEAGRHMAILGECAAAHASHDIERSYYLVTAAHVVRGDHPRRTTTGPLLARATATRTGSSALARVTLRRDGQELCRLSAHYLVLAERQLPGADDDAPGKQTMSTALKPFSRPLPVALQCLGGAGAAGTLVVTEQQCQGHLIRHPRLPVAVLMSGITGLITDLMRFRYQDPTIKYRVLDATVRATALPSPGELLRLAVVVRNSRPPTELLMAEIWGASGSVASARVRIRVLPHTATADAAAGQLVPKRLMRERERDLAPA